MGTFEDTGAISGRAGGKRFTPMAEVMLWNLTSVQHTSLRNSSVIRDDAVTSGSHRSSLTTQMRNARLL